MLSLLSRRSSAAAVAATGRRGMATIEVGGRENEGGKLVVCRQREGEGGEGRVVMMTRARRGDDFTQGMLA